MGSNGSKSGLYKGTAGNPQSDLGQEELMNRTTPISREVPLEKGIKLLSEAKVKFDKKRSVFRP